MSFFLGGGGSKVKPQFTGLQAQTSTGALPRPWCRGKNRIAPNILWQGDFESHKHKQKAGKGGLIGTSQNYYTYSASFILGLCWGVILDVTKVWKDQSTETDYTALGFTLFTGTTPQTPWGYLTTNHPAEAIGYSGIAYLSVANYDLGQSNALPQHSFEVEAKGFNTGYNAVGLTDGADPAVIIDEYLTDPDQGVGIDSSIIENLYSTGAATTTGDSAFQTYCRAIGFSMSPFLVSQEAGTDTLKRWGQLCNTDIVYTGYSLKFHPLGPDNITNNGVTYLADFPIRYNLTLDDFVFSEGEEPLRFTRSDPSDAYNGLSLIINNKDNEYNELPVDWRDQGLIDQYGRREDDTITAKEITEEDMAGLIVGLIGQKKAYSRNTFNFTLGAEYSLLEPSDIVTVTTARLGTNTVKLIEIEEGDDNTFSITAEEYNGSVSASVQNSRQPVSNIPINTGVSPGPVNPPIIFEPPSSLSGTPQVWVAVSGGNGTNFNPNWGGCYVYISTDNITYEKIGEINNAARMGVLSAVLATHAGPNPDITNTLSVNLEKSGGDLDGASASDAAAGATLSYVDGELISYEDATLTTIYNYDNTNLYRGLFGSTVGSHSLGTNFARLDEDIFKYNLDPAYVGVLLYIKFQSFNIFGQGFEDLSSVTAYTYTPTGAAFGTGTGGVPSTPSSFGGSSGDNYNRVTWALNPDNDNVLSYQVWRVAGPSGSFGSSTLIASVSSVSTEYVDTTGDLGSTYTYFLVAVNEAGSSSETTGVDLTSTISIQPFGFAFGPKTPVISKNLAVFDTPIAWTMPSGLPDSQATIVDSDSATAAAPSASTSFDIQSPFGVSVGTMTFAASSLTATFAMGSDTSVPLGQPTYIICPSNLNGITGAITGAIKGTR